MRILITRTTVADGRIVRAGSVEDLSDADAALLLQLCKAVPAAEAASEPEPAAEPAAEPEAPKRKGRKRGAE